MKIYRRIQNDYDQGGIEVQIYFEVENDSVNVITIQIHSTFDTGLPFSPTFENESNKDFLVAHYFKDDKKVFEYVTGNMYADKITGQIRHLINEIVAAKN